MTRPKSAACTFSDHLYSMPSSASACCRATWIWWSHGSSIGVAKIEATFSFLSCANAMPRQRGGDEPHAADFDDIAARQTAPPVLVGHGSCPLVEAWSGSVLTRCNARRGSVAGQGEFVQTVKIGGSSGKETLQTAPGLAAGRETWQLFLAYCSCQPLFPKGLYDLLIGKRAGHFLCRCCACGVFAQNRKEHFNLCAASPFGHQISPSEAAQVPFPRERPTS